MREVDVSACRARGLPRGYGHARITYALGGTVTEILIDEPAGLTPVAVACLAERYRDASVPPFQGTTRIEVGTTWYAP